MERGMETFQRDYNLVEDGYKNHHMKANSEASLPPSERMPSAENRFHAYLLARIGHLSAELIRTVADKPATAAGGTVVCIIAG